MSNTVIVILITAHIVTGWASHYDQNVMDRVIATRQAGHVRMTLPQELPDVDGYIAVQDCSEIGNVWLLRVEGTQKWSSYLVADCAGGPSTVAWMVNGNILCEWDWQSHSKNGGRYHRGLRIERLVFDKVVITVASGGQNSEPGGQQEH